MKCTDDLRIPAEWEETEYILLTMPEADTDWGYMLEEVRGCYRELILTMTKAGEHVVLLCKDTDAAADLLRAADSNLLTIVEADYNDTWIRDYGPLTADRQGRRRALDFGFNGWGLKFAADRDNLVNLRLSEKGIINPEAYRNERDFILEGGSIESDGRGTLLTTSRCLCSPNRNGGKSKSQLNEILRDRLAYRHACPPGTCRHHHLHRMPRHGRPPLRGIAEDACPADYVSHQMRRALQSYRAPSPLPDI